MAGEKNDPESNNREQPIFGRIIVSLVVIISAAFQSSCFKSPDQEPLTVNIGQPVHYISDDGCHFKAKYGSLSDKSLHFVKVTMPDGREHTLPQVISASGVRYTDERALVWWAHKGTVHVEVRDEDGRWITKYRELREIPEKH